MSILVVSVSHKTASMEALARLALDGPGSMKLAGGLVASDFIDEAVVLSTCNRTEIYVGVDRFHGGLDDVTAQLAESSGIALDELCGHCTVHFDEGAVAHLFSVTAGLDSMVVGENQILGQVRAALTNCQQAGTVGTVLNALFQQGIRVAKRVHRETAVGTAGRSLVTAAFHQLTQATGPLLGQRVTVIGAGSMASLAARTAASAGAQVTCVNRTLERAQRLAAFIGGRALAWSRLGEAMESADAIVTCTGARDIVVTADMLAGTSVRGIVDLALPGDVATDVAELDQLTLVNLAGLINGELRDGELDSAGSDEVESARLLVQTEVQDFLGVRRAVSVAPTVVALRTMASAVVATEMKRLDSRLPGLSAIERAEVQRTVRRVADKLLHHPTVRVQELATEPHNVDYAAALRDLFDLDPSSITAVLSSEVGQ